MKKILFVNIFSNYLCHHYPHIEFMRKEISNGNEVFSLGCYKELLAPCTSNQLGSIDVCRECTLVLERSLKLIQLKPENQLKIISNSNYDSVPDFKTQDDLCKYTANGINIGFPVANSVAGFNRDHLFDIKGNNEIIRHYLKQEYRMFETLQYYYNQFKFDEMYVFNGRFVGTYSVIQFCKQNNIDFYITERGANKFKYEVFKNESLHGIKDYENRMQRYWNKNDKNRESIALQWFYDKRKGKELSWISFVSNQKNKSVPQNFNKKKDNIAIFNSSIDEYFFYDEYNNQIDKDENKVITAIAEYFQSDTSKHFYLRMHPNLTNKESSQYKELLRLKRRNYNNFTVILPDENISTYTLMDICDTILVLGSTMGIESAFWGKPVIQAGKSYYEYIDCTYTANNYEELFNLIKIKLEPKPKANTLPFGYWQAVNGIELKDYEPIDLYSGTFLGLDLRKEEVGDDILSTYARKIKVMKDEIKTLRKKTEKNKIIKKLMPKTYALMWKFYIKMFKK